MESKEQADNTNDQPQVPFIAAPEEVHGQGTPDGGVCNSEIPQAPPEFIANGPWFVLVPKNTAERSYDHSSDRSCWNAERFDNATDADARAVKLVREGHPLVYIGRGMFQLEIPVQMTQLIERKPVMPNVA